MINKTIHLVITSGEPAGIGPEVSFFAAIEFLKQHENAYLTILGDQSLFANYQSRLEQSGVAGRLSIAHIPLVDTNTAGVLNPKNATYVLNLLDSAIDGCLSSRFEGMVTAPIQKSVISDLGIPFSGHTEYLAEKTNTKRVIMMLSGKNPLSLDAEQHFRVALVTTHLPLRDVPEAISYDAVLETIQIVHQELHDKFGIAQPNIKVTGLNPHAGESGHLGREEIESITPAIEFAKRQNLLVSGPYPADTVFDLAHDTTVDAYIAMYHDQGLAPFKLACFGQGVNITLGLPLIRTSVDHGTALDIAGKQMAETQSMYLAIELAFELAQHGTSNT